MTNNQTGPNRQMGLIAAAVNIRSMKEQYDWAAGRLEDALTRFADYIPNLEANGNRFSTALREIQQRYSGIRDGTKHSLADHLSQEQVTEFDNFLVAIGYDSRGGHGFFYGPGRKEDELVKVVNNGFVYNRKGDLFVTSRPNIFPRSFGVKNPFERLATDLEQRVPYVAEVISEFQKARS